MFIIKHRKLFFVLSGVLVAAAIASVAILGIRFGIEFTGGSVVEVTYQQERPEKASLEERLATLNIGTFDLRALGEQGYLLRSETLTPDEHEGVLATLSNRGTIAMTEERFSSIGPAIGAELRTKALIALSVVAIAIVLFIAFAFRGVTASPENREKSPATSPGAERRTGPSSFKYGIIAVVALLHDILLPLGAFAVLGALFGFEIDVLFVVALLTILGYSVNDTIVVFDRVRENLRKNTEDNVKEPFEETVGKGLTQTIPRSVNTSLTTLLVLLALFFIGGDATQHFALTLIVGVAAGTYSSLFLASPLLVAWEHMKVSNQ